MGDMMIDFTAAELKAVCRWLEARHKFLHDESLCHEADDFAHSNGTWPTIQRLRSEASATKVALTTARDQMEEAEIRWRRPVTTVAAQNRFMSMKVEDLRLPKRPANCLKNEDIIFIGDLVQKTEVELSRIPNFGKESLDLVKRLLEAKGLNLGMSVVELPETEEETSDATT
jgi:DNA-directed RNA polymerase alpha subunit